MKTACKGGCGFQVLSSSYFGYFCVATWEEVQELYLSKLHKELKLETIKRFGSDAVRFLRDTARGAKELEEWEKRHWEEGRKKNAAS